MDSIIDKSAQTIKDIRAKQKEPITATPRNILFGVLIVAGGLLASMMVLQILTGILALIFCVVATVGLFLGLRFLKALDPVIKQKTRNIVLNAMIEDAKENNMLYLRNVELKSGERLGKGKEARNKLGGKLKTLQSRLDTADKNDPYYRKKVEMTEQIEKAYKLQCTMYEKAKVTHKELKSKISAYADMASFSDIVEDAFEMIGSNELEDMLSMEAFGAIEDDFNTSMSTLEGAVMDLEDE